MGFAKRWRGTLKGYGTALESDEGALNNNRSMLTGDGEALKGDG